MALPLISRDDIERRLKQMGCKQIQCIIPDHTMWVTPWGFGFFVPHPPPEGMLSEFHFNLLMQQISKSKPPLH